MDQKIDQVLDIRILRQIIGQAGKDGSQVNVINIGTIVSDGNGKGDLEQYGLDELMFEILSRLPHPRHKHLENLAVRTVYEKFSDRNGKRFLGMAAATFQRRMDRAVKQIDAL